MKPITFRTKNINEDYSENDAYFSQKKLDEARTREINLGNVTTKLSKEPMKEANITVKDLSEKNTAKKKKEIYEFNFIDNLNNDKIYCDDDKLKFWKRLEDNKRRNKKRMFDICVNEVDNIKDNLDVDFNRKDSVQLYTRNLTPLSGNNHRGMIYPTKHNCIRKDTFINMSERESPHNNDMSKISIEEEVETRYPYRSSQIRLLLSAFLCSIRQTNRKLVESHLVSKSKTYIPPPVCITGGSGTGKTSIVRDVLNLITKKPFLTTSIENNNVTVCKAYINCAIIEPPTVLSLLEEIYIQLAHEFYTPILLKGKCTHLQLDDDLLDVPKFWKKKSETKKMNIVDTKSIQELQDSPNDSSISSCKSEELLNAYDHLKFEVEKILNEEEFHDNDEEKGGDDAGNERISNVLKSFEETNSCDDDNILNKERVEIRKQRKVLFFKHDNCNSSTSTVNNYLSRKSLRLRKVKDENSKMFKKEFHRAYYRKHKGYRFKTPMALGRALSKICSVPKDVNGKRGCAFLVLDHADKLFTFTKTKRRISLGSTYKINERVNILSQLLLLPKVLNLNLTVITVSQDSLLNDSRINNIQSSFTSLGTVFEAVKPLNIHFHAYRGKSIFSKILLKPKLRQLVTGINLNHHISGCKYACEKQDFLVSSLYESIVDSLVQSVENMARNISEMIRLLRIFWPLYLMTFVRIDIKNLLTNKPNEDGQKCCANTKCICHEYFSLCQIFGDNTSRRKLLEILSQKIRPKIRQLLATCLLQPANGIITNCTSSSNSEIIFSLSSRLPYVTKFLLLAGYLCQSNRDDFDRKLYTNVKTGKRKKNDWKVNEHISFSSNSTSQQELRSMRVSCFSLERLLSIFTSIFSKYGSLSVLKKPEEKDDNINLGDLGSIMFFESLANLRKLGIIKEVISQLNIVNSLSVKYACYLSHSDAIDLSNSVQFPLSEYLI